MAEDIITQFVADSHAETGPRAELSMRKEKDGAGFCIRAKGGRKAIAALENALNGVNLSQPPEDVTRPFVASNQLIEDVRAIRGILDWMRQTAPTVFSSEDVILTQNLSEKTARRLMKRLNDAGLVERVARARWSIRPGVVEMLPLISCWTLAGGT